MLLFDHKGKRTYDCIFYFWLVNMNFATVCSQFDLFSKYDALWNSFYTFYLWKSSCREQDIHSLLETCLPESWYVSDSIDSKTIYWNEFTSCSHPVGKNSKMAMIDVDTVRFEHFLDLVDETLTSSFNSEHCVYFIYVVTDCSIRINIGIFEAFLKITSNNVKSHLINSFFQSLSCLFWKFKGICYLSSCFDCFDSFDSWQSQISHLDLFLLDKPKHPLRFNFIDSLLPQS